MKLSPDIIERVLADKHYWRQLAAQMMAESSQRTQRGEPDSAIFEIGASPLPPLGKIVESRLMPQTRVRLSSGPRPMISEVSTILPSGGVISQRKALRLKRDWNRVRLRAQEKAQRSERGDAAGAEEEDSRPPIADHPGASCSDAHPNQSHDDYMDSEEEEEEEERKNPLFRQNNASARFISPSRRTRERER